MTGYDTTLTCAVLAEVAWKHDAASHNVAFEAARSELGAYTATVEQLPVIWKTLVFSARRRTGPDAAATKHLYKSALALSHSVTEVHLAPFSPAHNLESQSTSIIQTAASKPVTDTKENVCQTPG